MTYEKRYCNKCGRRFVTGNAKACDPCNEANRIYRARKISEIPAGVCRKCKGPNEAGHKNCKSCRRKQADYMKAWNKTNPRQTVGYQRDFNKARRERVIEHYGGRCACCGESRFEFLAIDHINGGGDKHRLEVGRGSLMVAWIIRQGFPDGFQLLCHNCNQAKGYYGACPHEREREALASTMLRPEQIAERMN